MLMKGQQQQQHLVFFYIHLRNENFSFKKLKYFSKKNCPQIIEMEKQKSKVSFQFIFVLRTQKKINLPEIIN